MYVPCRWRKIHRCTCPMTCPQLNMSSVVISLPFRFITKCILFVVMKETRECLEGMLCMTFEWHRETQPSDTQITWYGLPEEKVWNWKALLNLLVFWFPWWAFDLLCVWWSQFYGSIWWVLLGHGSSWDKSMLSRSTITRISLLVWGLMRVDFVCRYDRNAPYRELFEAVEDFEWISRIQWMYCFFIKTHYSSFCFV